MGAGVLYQGQVLIESQFLAAENIPGGGPLGGYIETIRTGVEVKNAQNTVSFKPAFKLSCSPKEWILNATNLKSLAKVYGKNADEWLGKPVVLVVQNVNAFGEMKDAIRVDIALTKQAFAKFKARSKKAEPKQDAVPALDDDEAERALAAGALRAELEAKAEQREPGQD